MENHHFLEIHILPGLTPYQRAWDLQKRLVQELDDGAGMNTLLLLEHPPIYTLGRGGDEKNLLISHQEREEKGIDFLAIDRGGDITYHGPGQLVGYLIFQLDQWGNDPHLFLRLIEESIIRLLKPYGIEGERKKAYTGVWVKDEKIAAIGVKMNRRRNTKGYISSHGFALNLFPDLTMFKYINPCGITQYGVTSVEKVIGRRIPFSDIYDPVVNALSDTFQLEVVKQTLLDLDKSIEYRSERETKNGRE